jgi:UDP-3-O-[3-hydroxymyristoyl] glucosamine N-acyltransferase
MSINSIVETKKIGKDFILGEFSIIRECVVIGDNTEIREHCIIGSLPFIFSGKGIERKQTIEMGKVIIGNKVYISCFSNISRGSTENTIIEDDVLINSFVMVGHDVHIHKNVELMNYVNVSGFSTVGENTFIGVGAMVRNRVHIGKNCVIGMGSNVVKDIPDGVIAYGNPCIVIENNKPNSIHSIAKRAIKKVERLI